MTAPPVYHFRVKYWHYHGTVLSLKDILIMDLYFLINSLFIRRVRYYIACLLLLLAGSINGYGAPLPHLDSLFHQSYTVRSVFFFTTIQPALRAMPVAGALATLDSLEKTALQLDDPEAALEVRLNRFEFRNMTGLNSHDEHIAGLERFLADEQTQLYPAYVAVIMANLGNSYFGIRHDYARAFDYLLKAHKIASTYASKDFSDKKLIYLWLGNRYYTLGDYTRSEKILLEADTMSNTRDNTSRYNCKNTIGLIYRAQRQYVRALDYFAHAHDLALQGGDSLWAAITSGNTGITYYLQGHFEEALPLLQQDVVQGFRNNGFPKDNGMNSLLIIAEIHLKQGQTAALRSDIALAYQYLDSCRDRVKPLSMLYPILASYHYGQADYKSAYQYLDSAKRYGDSISRRDNIYKLASVEHRRTLEQATADMTRLTKEKKLLAYARNGLLACIILFVISAGLFINRLRLRHSLQQAKLFADKQAVENDLLNATVQLNRYTQHLHEKNLLIEEADQNMQELMEHISNTNAREQHTEAMQQLYQSTILTEDEWTEFKLLFERVHKGYLHRLREKMPDLTPAETRFIVLSKLQLSNKEMAGILGVQADTIRSYKHRLKKRFDLAGETAIKEFVDSI